MHQQAHGAGLVGMGPALNLVAGAQETFTHQLLRLALVKIHHQQLSGGKALEGQFGADEIERTGGTPQVELGPGARFGGAARQPNRPPNKPLLWGCLWPLLVW